MVKISAIGQPISSTTTTADPSSNQASPTITIGRTTGNIYINNDPEKQQPQAIIDTYGIMGLIQLQDGHYLILITKREKVGAIRGHPIYRIDNTRIIPLATSKQVMTAEMNSTEEKYIGLLKQALDIKSFYYSTGYDLTSSMQRQDSIAKNQSEESQGREKQPLWKLANDEFFFNRHISNALIQSAVTNDEVSDVSDFIIPVINGYCEQALVTIKNKSFRYTIVTRRGRLRQGTRYFSRGADDEGNVSNYAETEQIVEYDPPPTDSKNSTPAIEGSSTGSVQMSFVQVRGSIPLAWYQIINMKYVPTLRIEVDESKERFVRHFDLMLQEYQNVFAINLVNKVKYEKPMGDIFKKLVDEYKSTRLNDQGNRDEGAGSSHLYYTHFDFHKECSKMRWHRISLLIDELDNKLKEFGYYYNKSSPSSYTGDDASKIETIQTGVMRTNCMDCLDRTNVVQSVIARSILTRQLQQLDIIGPNETPEMFEDLENTLRNIWADNADAVSCAYSGTGALKTDFTRTGKRTKLGALQDARNSIERYIRGNFFDGKRQDSVDLLLGKYIPIRGYNPFKGISLSSKGTGSGGGVSKQSLALITALVFSLCMMFIGIVYPPFNRFTFKNAVYIFTWEVVAYLIVWELMKYHTSEVLCWPKFNPYPYRPPRVHVNGVRKVPFLSDYLEPSSAAALGSSGGGPKGGSPKKFS
ncbi:Phosphoinositide phosphatase sac1 [Mycoemilia scoparia]|uniref:Phosphoinositide phosphatase sac1 n=1 Tax=Mycoemilia scoparia TaxID=417184 RepID=A0A9W8DSN7_9FUNG|nr:Phosphoinositide phosphatase sac1 [Mycoemilia scoparia]